MEGTFFRTSSLTFRTGCIHPSLPYHVLIDLIFGFQILGNSIRRTGTPQRRSDGAGHGVRALSSFSNAMLCSLVIYLTDFLKKGSLLWGGRRSVVNWRRSGGLVGGAAVDWSATWRRAVEEHWVVRCSSLWLDHEYIWLELLHEFFELHQALSQSASQIDPAKR